MVTVSKHCGLSTASTVPALSLTYCEIHLSVTIATTPNLDQGRSGRSRSCETQPFYLSKIVHVFFWSKAMRCHNQDCRRLCWQTLRYHVTWFVWFQSTVSSSQSLGRGLCNSKMVVKDRWGNCICGGGETLQRRGDFSLGLQTVRVGSHFNGVASTVGVLCRRERGT